MIEEVKVWYRDAIYLVGMENYPSEVFKCRNRKRDGNLLIFKVADGEIIININTLLKLETKEIHKKI